MNENNDDRSKYVQWLYGKSITALSLVSLITTALVWHLLLHNCNLAACSTCDNGNTNDDDDGGDGNGSTPATTES